MFCQHDERECELNALHACIIEHMELRKAFELINCMLRSYSNQIDSCARHLSYDVTAAKECKQTRKTAEILLPYGKETLALGLSFVPTIVFDNVSNLISNESEQIYNIALMIFRNLNLTNRAAFDIILSRISVVTTTRSSILNYRHVIKDNLIAF